MKNIDTLIEARWIIPVEPARTVLENHSLAVQEGKITALLPQQEARQQFNAKETISLPGHALIPGLVNAHAHAAMNLLRGLADDLPLMEWLQNHIWPAESKHVSESFVYDGTLAAIGEMIKSGTTCFNDMYFFPDQAARACEEAGIRACLGLIMIDFPTPWGQGPDDYLHKSLKAHDELRHNALLTTCFAPHAPYSVSDGPIQKLITLAEELDINIHMHIHETVQEVEDAVKNSGIRPLARLQQLGLLTPRLMAIHMTQLNDEEIMQLAETGAHVVHCPESNLKLASGFCRTHDLLQAGVNVALGTDGAASNNDLDMLSEMRTAALLAKGLSQNASAVAAHQALEMATLNGARALKLNDKIGSLVIDKSADITAINLSTINSSPVYNPLSQIVYATSHHQVSDVWVAGKQLLKNGILTTLNEEKLLASINSWKVKISTP